MIFKIYLSKNENLSVKSSILSRFSPCTLMLTVHIHMQERAREQRRVSSWVALNSSSSSWVVHISWPALSLPSALECERVRGCAPIDHFLV